MPPGAARRIREYDRWEMVRNMCHCEAFRPWQSPGTDFCLAVRLDRLYQEIAASASPPRNDSQRGRLAGITNRSVNKMLAGGSLTRPYEKAGQFTSGNVKVKVVKPSTLVTEISSPWLHTMVFTM